MYKKEFFKRLKEFGIVRNIILSPDTFIALIVGFVIYIITKGNIDFSVGKDILNIFIQVSASLFGIVLAGLAIVTSFTDKDFIYVWKKIGQFDNLITLFQFNLYIPILVLLFSLLMRFIYYHSIVMIIMIAFFAYMVMSLMDLVSFISTYGLQRGEFVKQLKELDNKQTKKKIKSSKKKK